MITKKTDQKEIEKLKKQDERKDLKSRQVKPIPNWKCCMYANLTVICLLSSFCLAELPPLESLNLKEQIIIAELSRDVMPDANLVIRRAIALERNDHNDDGTIDLIDFAIFASDYGLFRPVVDKVSITEPKEIVYQDETTTVIRYGEPNMPIYADFNDLSFVNYYLNEYLESE